MEKNLNRHFTERVSNGYKHMNTCLTSSFFMKMNINTMIKRHYTSTRIANSLNKQTKNLNQIVISM